MQSVEMALTAGRYYPPFLRDFLHGHYLRDVGVLSPASTGLRPFCREEFPVCEVGHGAFGDDSQTCVKRGLKIMKPG